MQAYRVETTLTQEGAVTLTNLPFQKGDTIEVIILRQPFIPPSTKKYSLRGTVLKYIDPTEPVAQDDWAVLT